jgi:hypothetical protein
MQVLINDTTHRLDGVRMHVLRDSSQGDLWGPDADSLAQEVRRYRPSAEHR